MCWALLGNSVFHKTALSPEFCIFHLSIFSSIKEHDYWRCVSLTHQGNSLLSDPLITTQVIYLIFAHFSGGRNLILSKDLTQLSRLLLTRSHFQNWFPVSVLDNVRKCSLVYLSTFQFLFFISQLFIQHLLPFVMPGRFKVKRPDTQLSAFKKMLILLTLFGVYQTLLFVVGDFKGQAFSFFQSSVRINNCIPSKNLTTHDVFSQGRLYLL